MPDCVLVQEFERRRQRNPNLSMRGFARLCNLSPATLSQIMANKRPVTELTLDKLRRVLNEDQIQELRSSRLRKDTRPTQVISQDVFRSVADWYHFAILSASKLSNNSADPAKVAQVAGISEDTATEALERLKRLGLLKIEKNRLVQTTNPLVTSNDVPSRAIQTHHRQVLDRAKTMLRKVPVKEREFGSMVMAVDPSKLDEAKKEIRNFRQKMAKLCEGTDPKHLYSLTIQFYPTKGDSCDDQ